MRSVIQNRKECYICHTTLNLHEHHIFYGTSCRAMSEKRGMKCFLCYRHHNGSDEGVHFNPAYDLKLKQIAQRYYEEHIGDRKQFISEFIRSYLEEE